MPVPSKEAVVINTSLIELALVSYFRMLAECPILVIGTEVTLALCGLIAAQLR